MNDKERVKQMIEQFKEHITDEQRLWMPEVEAIYEAANGDKCKMMAYGYYYGYAKGRKSRSPKL